MICRKELLTNVLGKREARNDVAYKAVLKLVQLGFLDKHYNPVTRLSSEVTDDASAEDSVSIALGEGNQWPLSRPLFWRKYSQEYFVSRLVTDKSGGVFASLLLVTGSPLPIVPPMTFWHKHQAFHMTCSNVTGHVVFSNEQIQTMSQFTTRLMKIMVNKNFAETSSQPVRFDLSFGNHR